jgi:hypothetical protein
VYDPAVISVSSKRIGFGSKIVLKKIGAFGSNNETGVEIFSSFFTLQAYKLLSRKIAQQNITVCNKTVTKLYIWGWGDCRSAPLREVSCMASREGYEQKEGKNRR